MIREILCDSCCDGAVGNRNRLKTLITYTSCLLLLVGSSWLGQIGPLSPVRSQAAITEVRGVWITNVSSGVLYRPGAIPSAIRQLAQARFNTIYPVVWNRGNTFYPSAVAAQLSGRSQEPMLSVMHLGEDVLAKLVTQAHQHHMRVIPWFEYGLMAPAEMDWVTDHPDWLTMRSNGRVRMQDDSEDGSGRSRRPLVWLNPFHPDVQKLLLNLIAEVVKNYDIEGIQLDDHFGLPVEFGYDAYTVSLYQKEHDGNLPPTDTRNHDWMRWRADKLNQFMRQIYQTVKSINPNCVVSLSPNSYSFAYSEYLQDWSAWIENGWVDELVVQDYKNNLSNFLAEIHQSAIAVARTRIPVSIGIHAGSPKHPVPFSQIRTQVKAVREEGLAGFSFFYWETLWSYLTPDPPHLRRSGFQNLFQSSIPVKKL